MDPTRDESLVFELLDLKQDVGDDGSAVWFLQDLAMEQDAEGFTVVFILVLFVQSSNCELLPFFPFSFFFCGFFVFVFLI